MRRRGDGVAEVDGEGLLRRGVDVVLFLEFSPSRGVAEVSGRKAGGRKEKERKKAFAFF
jgi:hypothetical protein